MRYFYVKLSIVPTQRKLIKHLIVILAIIIVKLVTSTAGSETLLNLLCLNFHLYKKKIKLSTLIGLL